MADGGRGPRCGRAYARRGGGAARMCPLHMDRVAAGGRAGAGELVAYAEQRETRLVSGVCVPVWSACGICRWGVALSECVRMIVSAQEPKSLPIQRGSNWSGQARFGLAESVGFNARTHPWRPTPRRLG